MTKLKKIDMQEKETFSSLENIYEDWVEGQSYDFEARVVYQDGVYVSGKDGNTAIPTDTLSWIFEKPSNRTGLYDNYPTTISKSTQEIVLKYENLNIISMLILSNIVGSTLYITLKKSNGDIVLEREVDLVEYREPTDYWQYCFLFGETTTIKDWIEQIETVEIGLSLEIKIVPNGEGVASIGFLAVGRLVRIGCTHTGLTIDKQPIIEVVRDSSGRLIQFGGSGWKKYNFTLSYNSSQELYESMKDFDEKDGELTIFIGDDIGEILIYTVIGVYMGYSIDVVKGTLAFSVFTVDTY
jgi:hypothetical protein